MPRRSSDSDGRVAKFGVLVDGGDERTSTATPAGFENKVAFIWRIADTLRGHLKPHEYGSAMLPTLVLFRLDAVLEPTKLAVLSRAQGLDLNSATADPLLRRAAGGLSHRPYDYVMSEATVRELRNQGGRVIDRVLAGERVTITRDGEPVAELVPIRRRPLSAEALMDRFRALPPMDPDDLRADIDAVIDQSL